jgi:hypothetical protein
MAVVIDDRHERVKSPILRGVVTQIARTSGFADFFELRRQKRKGPDDQ